MNRAILYEGLIFFLTLSYLTIILVGTTSSPVLSPQQIRWIDMGFIFFFAVEYCIRLYRAPRKWVFVKENIFDLVAMLPFDAFFRAARLMRLIRLVRLLKLSCIFPRWRTVRQRQGKSKIHKRIMSYQDIFITNWTRSMNWMMMNWNICYIRFEFCTRTRNNPAILRHNEKLLERELDIGKLSFYIFADY